MRKWIGLVVAGFVVVVCAGGIGAYALSRSPAVGPGDCIEVDGLDYEEVDCAMREASYRVARRVEVGTGCGSEYFNFSGRHTSRRVLCLTLNARVGDCFQQRKGPPGGSATKAPCDRRATYRVVKVVPGTADAAECGRDARKLDTLSDFSRKVAWVYPDPPLTVCTDRP